MRTRSRGLARLKELEVRIRRSRRFEGNVPSVQGHVDGTEWSPGDERSRIAPKG